MVRHIIFKPTSNDHSFLGNYFMAEPNKRILAEYYFPLVKEIIVLCKIGVEAKS